MPVASGSIAFLGAARFQGYWDASTNTGTGSIYGGISGEKLGLFETGSSPGAGYQVETGLTASKGDYWQVTGSGTHNVDSETSWQLNDFCIFSGSVSGQGSWKRLAFEDTVASIILGDLDSSSFHMGSGSDTQVIFGHGAVFSGSGDLSYKYLESKLAVAGIVSASAAQFDNITLGPSGLAGPAATVSSSAGTFAVLSGSTASLHRVLANSVTAVSQVTAATVSASSGQFATLSGSTITPHLITLGPGGLAGSAATVSASAGTFAVLSGSTVNVHALTSAGTLSAPTLSGSSGQFATLSGSAATLHNVTLNNVAVTSDAGEINLLDGAAAGTLASSKAVIYSSDDVVTGSSLVGFRAAATEGVFTNSTLGIATGSSFTGFSAAGTEAIYTTVSGNALSGHGLSVGNGDVRVNGGDIIVNNAGGGDAKIAFKIGDVHKWTAGIDASDNSLQDPKFKIRYSTAAADLAVGAHLELDSSGSLVLSGSLTATSGTVSASAGTYAILSGSAATINNLTLGNTAVTSDAGELNLLDGASAGSLASSKAVIYSAADIVTASAHVGFRSAATEGVFTSVTGSQITSFAGNFTELGNTLARHFTASLGMLVPDGRLVHFGTEQESHIRYDETGQDMLTISGSHAGGIALSGSKLMLDINGSPDIVASGSRGGPGSYLALAADGQVVLSTPAGSGGAVSSVANGADNRIATFSDSDALNGEANLTFNGSALTLAGTMTGSSYSGFNITATEGVFTTITGSSFAGFRSTATEVVGTTVSASSAGFAVLSGSALSAHTLAVNTFAPATVSASSGEFATLSGSAVTVDSLSLGNTAITSDAGEINLLDGSSAGALASSKAVIYSAADIVTGSAFVGFRATVSELGNTTANQLTASQGAKVVDNLPLHFGTDQDSHIRYDEAGQDFLTISGSSAGTVLSGSVVRVVDKLSVGGDMTSTKGSGILMVNAHADDTTNGLIATFKSGDSDYCRVNIDNSTANGDTQFTFMSNGSSKWSVGNMGSNETLHIKSGFGDFADGDPFVLTTTALTLNTSLTASSGGLIPDDKRLYFGDSREGHIAYDESAHDFLTISGSHAGGIALSGSKLMFDVNATPNLVASGSRGGPGSYLALSSTGQVVMSTPDGGGAISSVGNGADNRIATFSDSDALNGEANLTFNGSTLTLAGVMTGSSYSGFRVATTEGAFTTITGSSFAGFISTATEVVGTTVSASSAGFAVLSGSAVSAHTLAVNTFAPATVSASSGEFATLSGSTVTVNSLSLGNTAITSDAGEINLLDGASAGALASSKAVIYSAADVVTGSNFVGFGLQVGQANVGFATGSSLSAFRLNGVEVVGGTVNAVVASASAGQLHTLTLGNVNITSTGTEINLVNGSSAGALASSKAVIYSSTDVVTGSAFVGFRAAATEGAFSSTNGGVITGSSFTGFSANATKVVGAGGTFVALSGSATTVHTLAVGGSLAVAGTVSALEIENASDGGASALLIDNDDVDQIALEIEPANTTANIIELTGSALTTGEAIKVYSNSSDDSARSLVKIANDNTSATKAVGLTINQMGAAPAAVVRGSNIYNVLTHTGANAFVTGQTISASFIAGGQYNVAGRNSGQSDTTDTAANILAAMGDVAMSDFAEFFYLNMSSNSVTIAGGTNVLMANMGTASFAIAAGKARRFAVVVLSNHPASPKVQLVPTSDSFNITS